MDTRPLLFDLFCGGGAAGYGYELAGFHVVGIDNSAKILRHNPTEHYQADVFQVLDTLLMGASFQGYHLSDITAFHASPPCQAYSLTHGMARKDHLKLIPLTRLHLQWSGRPWIIENVYGARREMASWVLLCGTHFGLPLYRHRVFESSHFLFAPPPCTHPHKLPDGYMCIYGRTARASQHGNRENDYAIFSVQEARAALQTPWMNRREMGPAIPPAYTRYLGTQLLSISSSTEQAA